MTRIIDIARRRGLAEIFGDVLRENEPMLTLARALGFVVSDHPDDAQLVRVARQVSGNQGPGARDQD